MPEDKKTTADRKVRQAMKAASGADKVLRTGTAGDAKALIGEARSLLGEAEAILESPAAAPAPEKKD